MPSHHPRCVQHGLVVATDNMCVLCRKAAKASSQPPQETGHIMPRTAAELTAGGTVGLLRVVGLLGSLLLMLSGGTYLLKMSPAEKSPPQPTAAEIERPDPSPHEQVSELDRAVTASPTLLERAEAERDMPQKTAAQADPQRTAAEAAPDPSAQE